MNILLCGLLVTNGNLGCVALTYSAIGVLKSVSEDLGINFHYKIVASNIDEKSIDLLCEQLCIKREFIEGEQIRDVFRSKTERQKLMNVVKNWADVAIDATQGDSFADIYGWRRFMNYTSAKILIENSGVPLLLAPQTYGPYKRLYARMLAKYACNKASMLMSRDEISKNVLEKMGIRKPVTVVSDMAFFLPYNKQIFDNSVRNIGLNVSGLLWNGGYTNNNQFGLSVDYPQMLRAVIEQLKLDPINKIHLVSHVITTGVDSTEDDYTVCRNLAEEYGLECAPKFATPIEAKSYISGMDVFLGSRMHATIAAYSSGVATIPLAYSRKFVGLFNNLNYPYVIDLCNGSERELLDGIFNFIKNYETLSKCILESQKLIEDKKQVFINEISKWIENNNER